MLTKLFAQYIIVKLLVKNGGYFMDIEIKGINDNPENFQKDLVSIFVEGFHKDFLSFCDDKDVLKSLFATSFSLDSFFIAYMNNKAIGIIVYSDNRRRAMSLDKGSFLEHLGESIGTYAYDMMQKEFLKPLDYPNSTAYIEIVITSEEARGKSVAKKLLAYLFKNTKYSEFILEVGDTNEIAINLYKKIGFVEFERKKEAFPKETGFNERLFMKKII